MKLLGDPRVSPDGRKVAFVVTALDEEKNEYSSRIYMAIGKDVVRPFSSGTHRDSKPRWSPDGRLLAFVSHREEKGCQLYVMSSSGGEATRIAHFTEEVEDLAFSPDGSSIAFLVRDPQERYESEKPKDQSARRIDRLIYRLDSVGWTIDRPRHLFVIDVKEGAEPVQLTKGNFENNGLSWSPNGDAIAFASARHDGWDLDRRTDLFIIPSNGGEPRKVTETDSGHLSPAWSPNGSKIAVSWSPTPMDSPRHPQVAVVDVQTGERTVVSATLDRQCGTIREPVWVQDDVFFSVEDSGNIHLYRVTGDGNGKPELVVGGDRQLAGFDVAGGTTALILTSPTELDDLYLLDEEGEPSRLTNFSKEFSAKRKHSDPSRFVATSKDGSEVEAWCMKPTNFSERKKYPMLLNIHGGPFSQYGNKFFDEFQVLCEAGYVVVYSNPRGSSGYSESWGRAIRGPKATEPGSGWGGVDFEDLMAVTDEALEQFDFIDAERLGVLGGSYGGYMTSWIISHTDRFKAACSERALNNHLTWAFTADMGSYFKSYFGPSHLEDPEEYIRMSPITYVESINTPLLILHSETDLRCPISQAEEMFTALRLLNREVEFVRFPGESHELSRSGSPKHREERFHIILDWFDRHLKNGRASGTEAPEQEAQSTS